MHQIGPHISSHGIENHGLRGTGLVRWNYSTPALYEQALRRSEGVLAHLGPIVVRTGDHTGRASNDRFIVKEPSTEDKLWWGDVNRPITPEHFDRLHRKIRAYYQGRELFVQDCYAGADPHYRLPVRVVNETAWHNLFVRNMFIRPKPEELDDFAPEFTILHAPSFHADPEDDGTNSSTFVVLNLERRLVLIGGTSYGGEQKKSIFAVMNFFLPQQKVMAMHCSANYGPGGKDDVAVFFGLSGTGKTTLSADAERTLIGDDEHGWSDNGVFNFEGGCYAKVIKLTAESDPEIYETTRRFGTILENVMIDNETRSIDLDDSSLTENTRAAYPISHIPNASRDGVAGHPKNIIMLTADAFGVMPPVSKLTADQAMYHFLSGYTAKLAGTEMGLGSEPQAAFSTCFGALFMPLHPTVYARILGEKIAKHNVDCWLVNTGWSGGPYGVGERMKIAYTRAMVRAALNGSLADVPTKQEPFFGLQIPESCPDVPVEVLNPRNTWADKVAYDVAARDLVERFRENFKQYEAEVDDGVKASGPPQA